MAKHTPHIEVIPNNETEFPPLYNQKPWYRSPRFVIFSVVFLLSASISLVYVFSRPAVYRSNAVLLTVAAKDIDQRSSDADIQHVAIQRQVLTGENLLRETLQQIKQVAMQELGEPVTLTVPDMRNMLMVQAVPDTNLVELVAEGYKPKLLPLLINTWIDIYLAARERQIQELAARTTGALSDELVNLEERLDLKRTELDEFRRANDIASIGRAENAALARLKGLTASLNKASEKEVEAKSRLNAVRNAIARGQVVVPKSESRNLSSLENSAQKLRNRLKQLDQRFTREYIALQPGMKDIPDQLSEIEREIEILQEHGKTVALADAEQQYAAAAQTTATIRQQLEDHKQKVSDFTTRFAQHEDLKNDLEGLQNLFRKTQQRLMKIQTKQQEKYPQFSVVDRAFLPRDPIRPNYFIDAIIAVSGSIALGILSVWIFTYLTRKETDNAGITLSGIHMYEQKNLGAYQHPQAQPAELEHQHNNALAGPGLQEISFDDLHKLFELSSPKAQQLIALLLNGLSLQEILELQEENFDFEQQVLYVQGSSERVVPINDVVKNLFEQSSPRLLWQAGHHNSAEDLEAIIMCAVIDSGISHPDQVSSESLRHSFIIFLIRQGLKLSELEQIAGYLPPGKLATYRVYSPPSQGCSMKEIKLLHPALSKSS